MLYQIQDWLNYAGILTLITTIVIGFSYWPSLKTPFRIFIGFLVFMLIIEVAATYLASRRANNLPLLHLYTLGEFLFLSFFYRSIIEKPRIVLSYFLPFILLAAMCIVANTLFLQPLLTFNTYSKTLVQAVVIGYSILFFYYLSDAEQQDNAEQRALRLINSALILYYSGSLFIFMFSNYFIDSSDNQIFWVFNAFLNVLFRLLVLIALCRIIFRKTISYS